MDWENTTEDIKNNTEYWSDQALLFDQILQDLETNKPSMSHEEYISKKAEFEEGYKDSLKNLKEERRTFRRLELERPSTKR